MNVLILEDEQQNFNRLRRQLEEIDTTFHVEGPLANIQESVEWLRTHPTPDLILLKSATPFPKCYLHKEEWTFDS